MERWIGSLRRELLDRMLILNARGIYAESSPSTNTTSIPTHTDLSVKLPRYEHSPSPTPPIPRSSE
jgi:hypothetical protein